MTVDSKTLHIDLLEEMSVSRHQSTELFSCLGSLESATISLGSTTISWKFDSLNHKTHIIIRSFLVANYILHCRSLKSMGPWNWLRVQ